MVCKIYMKISTICNIILKIYTKYFINHLYFAFLSIFTGSHNDSRMCLSIAITAARQGNKEFNFFAEHFRA